MLKQTVAILLSISLGLPFRVQASSMRCSSVFIPEVESVIDSVNRNSSGFLLDGKTFSEFRSGLSWNRRRKIKSLIKEMSLAPPRSEEQIADYSITMINLLFGSRDYLPAWLKNVNGTNRSRKDVINLMKEEILNKGLSQFWKENSSVVPKVDSVIESIDRDTSGFLFGGKRFTEYVNELSWNQRIRIRRLIENITFENIPAQDRVEAYATELRDLLFGKPEYLPRWVLMNTEQRLKQSADLIIKDQLLKRAFVEVWRQSYAPERLRLKEKVLNRLWTGLWKVNKLQVNNGFGLPFILPRINNKELSAELLFKVIRDGFEVHKDEIKVALKAQSYREAYNAFARYYTPVLFGTILSVVTYIFLEELEKQKKETERFVQQAKEEFQQTQQEIEKLAGYKIEQGQEAFEKSLDDFRLKWNEDPTPEEWNDIRVQIEEGLGLPPGALAPP